MTTLQTFIKERELSFRTRAILRYGKSYESDELLYRQSLQDLLKLVAEEVNGLDYNKYVSTNLWRGSDGEDGYNCAKDDLLSLLRSSLQ